MVLSSTILIVSNNDRVLPRNAIITDYRPTNGTVSKEQEGIIQILTVQYICIFQVPFPINVNKVCSETMICMDIGSAL